MHLIGNMLYLWVFGNNIEDVMGQCDLWSSICLCGMIAALSHALTDPVVDSPDGRRQRRDLRQSWAPICCCFPARSTRPDAHGSARRVCAAGIVLGFWFVMQLLSGGMSHGIAGRRVAFFAHIGGFVAGMVLIGLFKRRHVPFFSPGHGGDGMADEWAFGHVLEAECLGLRVKETISETAKHLRESTHELRSTLSGKLCLIRQERHMSHLSPRTHHPLAVEMQHGSRNRKVVPVSPHWW